MARPSTKPADLKDGFYFEVRNGLSKSGIKIHRDTEKDMQMAVKSYEKSKTVVILGEMRNGKWTHEVKPKRKSRAKKKSTT